MKTYTVEAWAVEEGDFITLGGDEAFEVVGKNDDGSSISFTLTDDDGETETFAFTAYESIQVVGSFDDEPDPVIEDIED